MTPRPRVHLLGAGGAGVSALGHLWLDRGALVTGSDLADGPRVRELAARGARVRIGSHDAGNVPAALDLLVRSRAVSEENPEVLAAERAGAEALTLSEALARLGRDRRLVAVAGTHGKTTTASLLVHALACLDAAPSWVVGAAARDGRRAGGWGVGRDVVVEACEFERAFLDLEPDVAALLGVDEDHLDCYHSAEAVREAFSSFADRVRGGFVVWEEAARQLGALPSAAIVLSETGAGDVTVELARRPDGRFDVRLSGVLECPRFRAPLPGRAFARDAAAAAALLGVLGRGGSGTVLETFRGVRRRLERLLSEPVELVLDYAHHPTEIAAVCDALLADAGDRRTLALFEPHQVRRTLDHLRGFARELARFGRVLVADAHPARERASRSTAHAAAARLARAIEERGTRALAIGPIECAPAALSRWVGSGDLVVVLGAGRIGDLREDLVVSLSRVR